MVAYMTMLTRWKNLKIVEYSSRSDAIFRDLTAMANPIIVKSSTWVQGKKIKRRSALGPYLHSAALQSSRDGHGRWRIDGAWMRVGVCAHVGMCVWVAVAVNVWLCGGCADRFLFLFL
jgi:hypothetical protein